MQTACGSDGSGLRADTKAAVDRYVRWWGALGKGQFYCCDEDHSKVLRATHKGGLGAAKGGQNIQEGADVKAHRQVTDHLRHQHDVHVQPDEVGPLAAYLAAEVAQVPVEDLDGRALEGLPGLDVSLGRPRMDLRSTRGKRQPTAAVVQRCFCLLCYPDESLWAWKDGMSGEEMQAHLAASHPRCEGAKYRTIHLQKVLESTRVGGSNLPSKFVRVDAPETVDPPAAEPATEGAGQQGAAAAAADEEAAWRALRDRCRVVQPTVVFGDTAAAVDVPYRFATLLGMDTHFLNGVDLAAFQKLKARREMPGDHAVVALFLANFDVLGAAYFRGIALLHQDHKRDMGKIAGRSSGGAAKAKGAFPMQDSTIVSYLENWREVLVYLLRRFLIHTRKMTYDAGHLPRIDWSTQETQLPLEISTTIMPTVFPRRSVLDAFIDLVCFAEARLETPAADAGAAGWLDKLLTVSLALSEDIVAGDKFACALVGATAASCTRADGVKHPTVASKGISGIIACVKATFVAWSHRESALWSTGADWDFAYTMFARPYFAYFSTRPGALTSRPGSYVPITALACLYECRNVGIEESFNTAGLTTTALRDGGQTAIHGANSELNIHDFRAANGQQIARLHRCLVDLLLLDAAGLPEQASVPAMQAFIDNDVPFPDITDDWTDRESGTSAYTQTFGKDGPPLLLDRVWDGDRRRAWTTPDRVSGGVRFRQDATAAYFRQVHAFLGDLLVTAFLLAGVQSRGTEFLTMRHTNTPQHGQRNLFWFGNMCQWGAEIRYHKGDNDTEAGDSAWHFFPPHLSYVISYYLLYVQPFTQVLIQEMAGGATVDHSPFLCGTAPDAQRSRVLAGEIRRMMDRVPPSDLMQALAGCSGAARAAVAQEEMGDDYADDDGDESRLDGEYAYDKADPSNARLGHCWPRRPGGEDDGDMLGQLETLCRTLRGLARDSAMADAVDAGDGGSLAGITIGSGTGLVTSLWETAAPQQVPPRRASAGPSDFSPGFWNNRKFYIELARFFERRLGTKIGIASLRHIMEIWARHLTEGLREDAASLSTVQGMTDCLLGAMHEQAGHSDRTAAIKYALSQPFLHWGRGREKIGRHARASMVMHAFLLSDDMVGRPMTPTLLTRLSESPNDLGAEADAGRLRALLTSRDAVVQMNRLCAGDRAVNDQPLAFLQACCGEATLLPAPHNASLDPPDGRGPQRHVDAVFRASVERSNLSYRVRTYRALHDLVDSLACEITTRNTVTGHLPQPPKTIVLLFMDVASATVVADGLGCVLVCAAHHYKGDRRRQDAVRQALQEYEDAPDAYATATATAPAGRVAPEMAAAWRLEDVPCLVGTSVIGELQDVGADAVICVQGFPIGATTLDQGFGRGARDGRPGTATCFYKQGDADDALIAPARHAGADVTADEVGMAETRESKAVVAQFLSTSQCRRVPLATYFNWASRRTRCDSLTGDLLCDLCEDRKNDRAAADTTDAEGAGRATPARPTVHRAPPTLPADPAGPRRKLLAGWQQTGGGADRRKRVRRLDRDDAAARPKKAPPQTMTPSQEAHRHHRLPGDETSARGPRSHTLAPASSRARALLYR
ncbi:hypothetical protein CH63R_01776 [Colletotrichum higginsianum IMI 349063]|uniref:Uncharacterized protein n=1 Tax=Colletotrichum higginsianum (strain IMI 349063) TaxID=759273 RepID=A0A1B7YX36_COLHI|nr:hypothetical protein CH63R_01776 [Colletotrichum higginsianum IMI 349063]OBR16596.1 hypothetical protein CH63R_01776 [Colletotrichum higginsianum IMI 349063]